MKKKNKNAKKVQVEPEIKADDADEWKSDADDFDIDEAKERAWEKRDWRRWLEENLTFPFKAERQDGDDADLFGSEDENPFLVGARVEVLGLDDEEGRWGIQALVRRGKHRGSVALADLSVRPKTDKNFPIVLEYGVAVANEYVDLE